MGHAVFDKPDSHLSGYTKLEVDDYWYDCDIDNVAAILNAFTAEDWARALREIPSTSFREALPVLLCCIGHDNKDIAMAALGALGDCADARQLAAHASEIEAAIAKVHERLLSIEQMTLDLLPERLAGLPGKISITEFKRRLAEKRGT